jgi:hypothetical protein
MNPKLRDRIDVLGTAYPNPQGAGYFAYVFYDRVQELAQRRSLGHALLADVLAHEIGHLLLGSASHSPSGIMSAHWDYEELRNVSEGAMWFVPAQSKIMRDRQTQIRLQAANADHRVEMVEKQADQDPLRAMTARTRGQR